MSQKLYCELTLPNGRGKQFSLTINKNWLTDLEAELMRLYPRSDGIRFVQTPTEAVNSGRLFASNVMFRIRENYYELGHLTAGTSRREENTVRVVSPDS